MPVRITQAGVEVVHESDGSARITQAGVEVVHASSGAARVTQVGVEVLTPNLSQVQARCFIVG